MPTFDNHIAQAKRNFNFLQEIHNETTDSFDWQVTVSFYTALHLVNAHLAKSKLSFRKHIDVDNAISPHSIYVDAKLPDEIYLSYNKLQQLSRRARYLINPTNKSGLASFTYDRHLEKCLRHLDKIICFFTKKYDFEFGQCEITDTRLRKNEGLIHIIPDR